MSSHTPPPETDSGKLYEYFEEALGLFHAGKPYESVLSRCPAHLRAELRKQVELATRLVTISSTMAQPRDQAHRTQQRVAFMREVRKLQHPAVTKETTTKGAVAPGAESIRKVLQEFADRLAVLTPRLTPQAVPLLVILSLLLGGTIGVGTAAASALPGDFTYPVKEFVRDTRESLASPEKKKDVILENENARRSDNEKAAIERLNWITVTQVLVFYQKSDSILDIGGQSVLRGYPSDSNGRLTQMEYVGDPKPGDLVRLTYMIVPGKPNFVYGVKLEVIQAAPEPTTAKVETVPNDIVATATPIPADPTPVPTLSSTICEPVKPDGWVVYRIQADDMLTTLAVKTNTQVGLIQKANCRTNSALSAGSSIFLPAVEGITVPDPNSEMNIPTATSIPSYTPTSVVDETATPEQIEDTPTSEADASPVAPTEEPTTVETPAATEEGSDATATPEATEIAPTSDVTPEATPTEVLDTPTSESTIVETPSATTTEEPDVTPTESGATPTSSVEATATSVPDEPTIEPTTVIVATPTQAEATTEPFATTEPPPAVDTPVVVPTAEATLEPSVEPTVQSSSSGESTPVATQPVSPLLGPTSRGKELSRVGL
ncbi:MAG: hypothetical protein U0175_01100 [Caldilineaceae bacterium]